MSSLPEPEQTGKADGAGGPAPVPARGERGHSRSHQAPAESLNAVGLLKALRRRWLLGLGLGLVCGAVATVAAWFLVPSPKHTARTLLRVPPHTPFLLRTAERIPDLGSHQRTQVALLRSRLVLNAALRDPKVARLELITAQADPVQWLEKEVQADFSVAPEVLRVSLAGDRPDDLAVLVNALRESYLKEIVDKDRIARRERLVMLGELREKYEGQVRTSRDAQKTFEQKVGSRDPNVRARYHAFVQQQLGMAERELLQAQSELRKSRIELAALQAREKGFAQMSVPEPIIDREIDGDPSVRELRAETGKLEKLIADTISASRRGEREPAVRQYRTRLAQVQVDLTARRDKLRPTITRLMRDKYHGDLATNIAVLQGRIGTLESHDQLLKPEVERLQKRVDELTQSGIKLDTFREDMTHVENLVKTITNEEQALKIELQAPSPVSVLEEAIVTRPDARSRRVLMTAGAGLGALALALLAIAWLEYRARRVEGVDQVRQEVGLPLVGTVPDTSARKPFFRFGGEAASAAYVHNLLIESIDAVRAMLLRAPGSGRVRVVMVTSAGGGEGKTSLATHLAGSLARGGMRTLLVDCDLRNPSAHRVFDVPNEKGLCEVLRGEAELEDVSRPTVLETLSLIPAGRWDSATTRQLFQDHPRSLFGRLRERYDFIVLDSSPVLPVADALLIGKHVDGVVFSILSGVSRLPSVHEALRRLTAVGIRTLGVVVQGVEGDMHAAAYPYLTATARKIPEPGEQEPK